MGNFLITFIFITITSFYAAAERFLEHFESLSDILRADSPLAVFAGDEAINAAESTLKVEFSTFVEDYAWDELVTPEIVSQLVHGYFIERWGWELFGFERAGYMRNVPGIHQIKMLPELHPELIEALHRAERDQERLSLREVATLTAVLEKFVLDKFFPRFVDSWMWFTFAWRPVPKSDLSGILVLFLSQYHRMFTPGSVSDAMRVQEIIEAYDYKRRDKLNPFKPVMYGMSDVAELMRTALKYYADVQQDGCELMHDDLAQRSDAGGMIPVTATLTPGLHEEGFEFSESLEYLESVGAMPLGGAKAWLPNYMTGPSNCDIHLRYVMTCCHSMCQPIKKYIYDEIRSPEATPDALIQAVKSATSRYFDDHSVTSAAEKRIKLIADSHGGLVRLHSRSFDQWLHLIFPNECNYPSVTEQDSFRTPLHWWEHMKKDNRSKSELDKHARYESLRDAVVEREWCHDEVFYNERPSNILGAVRSALSKVVMVGALGAIVRIVRELQQTATEVSNPTVAKPCNANRDSVDPDKFL